MFNFLVAFFNFFFNAFGLGMARAGVGIGWVELDAVMVIFYKTMRKTYCLPLECLTLSFDVLHDVILVIHVGAARNEQLGNVRLSGAACLAESRDAA